jgi:hypothetical protein
MGRPNVLRFISCLVVVTYAYFDILTDDVKLTSTFPERSLAPLNSDDNDNYDGYDDEIRERVGDYEPHYRDQQLVNFSPSC